jgi:neutral ceramidase
MAAIKLRIRPMVWTCILLIFCYATSYSQGKVRSWKAGVAAVKITPEQDMWMAGYAARDKPSEGALHDLWAKVLALEDENGERAVFVTTDLIGLSRDISEEICSKVQINHHLHRSQIILTSSHTHSGPVINTNLRLIYPEFNQRQLELIDAYRNFLITSIVDCINQAFTQLTPAKLTSGTGISRFAVNRRNNTPEEVLYASEIKGPSDYAVPVISVQKLNGDLMTLLFGYACHCTTLSNNKWNGDYAGFAQIELEKMHPGCTAMFYASCAGDQNPEPRGMVAQAEQYGTELAAAIERVLKGEMMELNPELTTSYKEIELALDEPYTLDELKQIEADAPEWQQRWATHYIKKIEMGEKFSKEYPYYPVQSWQIGDQILIALGGEVVVDYAIKLKNAWGNDLFIAAYANDVMAYIPSERVLQEGGYEGNTSMRAYGHPAVWATGIESAIVQEVELQLKNLGRKRLTP